MHKLTPLAVVPLVLGACNRVDPVKLSQPSPPTVTKAVPVSPDLDVLFVIDNSKSTGDKQTVFAQNFPTFAQQLASFDGGKPNLHIGVVSSTVDIGNNGYAGCPSPDTADDGLLQSTAHVTGCSPPSDRFISDVANPDGTRVTNYPGTLPDTLACIAQLGTTGCGFEAQLEAMKRALNGSRGENAGFLRDNADLAVVFLTDEDDASADPSVFDGTELTSDFLVQPQIAYDCDTPISATDPGTYTNCTPHVVSRGSGSGSNNGGSGSSNPNVDAALDGGTGTGGGSGVYGMHNVNDYVTFLGSLKDPSQVFIGMIAGDPTSTISTGVLTIPGGGTQELALEPSCSATINGNPAIARPGIRLAQFTQAFANSSFQSVCQSDYSGALAQFTSGMQTMMRSCFPAGASTTTTAPSQPGLHLPCDVTDVVAGQTVATYPACSYAADGVTPLGAPCWYAETSSACQTGVELHVQRASAPSAGAVTHYKCLAAN
jgi:hypothetical protein